MKRILHVRLRRHKRVNQLTGAGTQPSLRLHPATRGRGSTSQLQEVVLRPQVAVHGQKFCVFLEEEGDDDEADGMGDVMERDHGGG